MSESYNLRHVYRLRYGARPLTNVLKHNRDLTQTGTGFWINSGTGYTVTRNQTGLDGVSNTACLLNDANAASYGSSLGQVALTRNTQKVALLTFIQADNVSSRLVDLVFWAQGGLLDLWSIIRLNTATGEWQQIPYTLFGAYAQDGQIIITPYYDPQGIKWWAVRCALQKANHNYCGLTIAPAGAVDFTDEYDGNDAATGSIIIDGTMIYDNVDSIYDVRLLWFNTGASVPDTQTIYDDYYFTSHDDIVIEGVDDWRIFHGTVSKPSTRTAKTEPLRGTYDVGSISFTWNDLNGDLTTLLYNQQQAGVGLLASIVEQWIGEPGQAFSEMKQIQTQQMFGNIKPIAGSAYQLDAQDIQRALREEIFKPKQSNLTASITAASITIPCSDNRALTKVYQGAAAEKTGEYIYIEIDGEIMRCTATPSISSITVDNVSDTLNGAISVNATTITVNDASDFRAAGVGYVTSGGNTDVIRWTNKSGNILQGVTGVLHAHATSSVIVDSNGRGALNTTAAAHEVNTDLPTNRRPIISEVIYYAGPAQLMSYLVMTGERYGTTYKWPRHWHLGIPAAWIATAYFTAIGADIWDTADETEGVVVEFVAPKKQKGFAFIYEQLNIPCGVFNPVLPNGQLGLRRHSRTSVDAPFSAVWDNRIVSRVSNARFDQGDVHNWLKVDYDYDPILKIYRVPLDVIDPDSVALYGLSESYYVPLQGLSPYIYTDNQVANIVNAIRNAYAAPPFKCTVDVPIYTDVTLGTTRRLVLPNAQDFMRDDITPFNTVDRTVEIRAARYDFDNKKISVDVFGSTGRAAPVRFGSQTNDRLVAGYFTGEGSNLASVMSGSSIGGRFTTSGNYTMIGVTDLASATATANNNQGIFYINEDFYLSAGDELTFTENVILKINGTFFYAGTLIAGNSSLAGGTNGNPGTSGFVGDTIGGAGLIPRNQFPGNLMSATWHTKPIITEGRNSDFPVLLLRNEAGYLRGLPRDIRNSSGSSSARSVEWTTGTSYNSHYAAGGTGKGSLIIICDRFVGLGEGSVVLGGNAGTAGSKPTGWSSGLTGKGGGSMPGNLVILFNSQTITPPDLSRISAIRPGNIQSANPVAPTQHTGPHLQTREFADELPAGMNYSYPNPGNPYSSLDLIEDLEMKNSVVYWDYVPENVSPARFDNPSTPAALPTISVLSEATNTPETSYGVSTITVTLTPPSDDRYSHSNVYTKLSTAPSYAYQLQPTPAANSMTFEAAMDGQTIDLRIVPVNIYGRESNEYIERQITLANDFGEISQGTINENMTILGASTVVDDTFFFDMPYWLSADGITFSGTGATLNVINGELYMTLPTTNGNNGTWYLFSNRMLVDFTTWQAVRRLLKFALKDTGFGSTVDAYIIQGNIATGYGFGWKWNGATSTWQTYVNNGGTITTSDETVIDSDVLMAIYDPLDATPNIKFYVNGTLVQTVTTNLPTGTNSANNVIYSRATRISAGSTSENIGVGSTKVLIGF